jgi:hypothetical protein
MKKPIEVERVKAAEIDFARPVGLKERSFTYGAPIFLL